MCRNVMFGRQADVRYCLNSFISDKLINPVISGLYYVNMEKLFDRFMYDDESY
jgi:hypothetical protein